MYLNMYLNGLLRKNERGYSYYEVDLNTCEFYLMFLSREIDKKTVWNLYENLYI